MYGLKPRGMSNRDGGLWRENLHKNGAANSSEMAVAAAVLQGVQFPNAKCASGRETGLHFNDRQTKRVCVEKRWDWMS